MERAGDFRRTEQWRAHAPQREFDAMNAEEILLAAVEKKTEAERAAFLEGACGPDAELRAQVESLLEAHREAGSFLEQPLFEATPTSDQPPDQEKSGTVIGPYKLLQQLGEGGMGTVYMAEQTQPVQRKVALKVIKAGLDSRQVIARFEAERQALAMMDHVNIARVLDAGATEAGLPYFVMELVHGVPITTYCDDNRLTPRERLELFVPVCQAIQHAHQKGIIHRDLKPSNVMITLYDGKPVPKVIDFGVAKATEQKLTERTLFTQYGTLVGTLEYMSPEQAEMSALGVDTRSDIYSLGVLLYELLTGSTPLTHQRLKEAAYAEILRMIKEEQPPKPSARLSDSGEALASISAQRHMEPAKLTKLVRGELDWIVMKTLEKDRNRRYETVNGLARDIECYLHDEPVLACPPSRWYRFRKFARRNRRALAIASAVVLAVLLAVVGLIVNNRMVTREKERADRNFERAGHAVNKYFTLVSEDQDLKAKGLEPLRRKLLTAARDYYAEFVQERGDVPALRAEFAAAHMRLGSITEDIADKGKAIEEYQQALALCQQLVDAQPAVADHQVMLARAHGGLGRLYHAVDRFQDSQAAYQRAVSIEEELTRAQPDVAQYRKDLATSHEGLGHVYRVIGQPKDAEVVYQKSAGIWEQLGNQFPAVPEYQSGLASSLAHLGDLFATTGRADEAEKAYQKALIVRRQLAQAHPGVPDYQDRLAACLLNLGLLDSETNRAKEAEAPTGEARDIWQKLADVHPTVTEYQHYLAASHNNLGVVYEATDRLAEAERAYGKAMAIRRQLADTHPAVIAFAVELGGSQCNMGTRALDAGKQAEALDWYAQAIATFEGVLHLEERHTTAREYLAKTHHGRAMALARLGRHADAVDAYTEALRLTPDVADVHCNLAFALRSLGRFSESLVAMKRGHELGLKKPGWSYPSAQWVRDCEILVRFDNELAAIQRGEAPPADAQERIGLAEFCNMYKRLPLTALRLWTGVFADGFPRAEDDKAIQMYNAALAAAQAGSGDGTDVAALDNEERARWRTQALNWLRAALVVWAERVENGSPADRVAIEKRMERWQNADKLASLRDGAALTKLPEAERELCRKLWVDVAALRARAKAAIPAPPGKEQNKNGR
jgi:eukaryotic-like serine/threonine-protein kinase